MKDYVYKYIDEIDKKLEKKEITKEDIEEHLIKIQFFQHERLIHLLVTLFYAIYTIAFGVLMCLSWLFGIIFMILMIVLLFYIVHYFRLENKTQYMYVQYDRMKEYDRSRKH